MKYFGSIFVLCWIGCYLFFGSEDSSFSSQLFSSFLSAILPAVIFSVIFYNFAKALVTLVHDLHKRAFLKTAKKKNLTPDKVAFITAEMQKSDFDEYKYFEEWAKEKLKLKNRSVDVIEELNTTIIDYAKYLAKNEELLLIMFNGDKEFGGKFGKILLDLKLFFDDTSVYCGFREVDFYEENLKQSAYYWNSAYNRYILNTEG